VKTTEDLLISYARAFEELKLATAEVSLHRPCLVANLDEDYGTGTNDDCLGKFFSAPKGPDGEFPRYREFYTAMCERCKDRLRLLDRKRDAKRQLGAHRRAILIRSRLLAKRRFGLEDFAGKEIPI
jgi:hypothetical protein